MNTVKLCVKSARSGAGRYFWGKVQKLPGKSLNASSQKLAYWWCVSDLVFSSDTALGHGQPWNRPGGRQGNNATREGPGVQWKKRSTGSRAKPLHLAGTLSRLILPLSGQWLEEGQRDRVTCPSYAVSSTLIICPRLKTQLSCFMGLLAFQTHSYQLNSPVIEGFRAYQSLALASSAHVPRKKRYCSIT